MHTEGDLALTLEAAWPASITDHFKTLCYATRTGPGASLSAIEREPATGKVQAASR